jgi:organic radical activating enzyme
MSIADAAIARMRGPRNMHIICIDVTNKCDLACSNCTRLLENQDHFWEITPENWRLALRSLKGYWGVIAMIGGNPCMHKNFAELCQIFEEEIPNKLQRGLWTNNYFKHRELCEKTFGTFNLNSHGEQRAEQGLTELATSARSNGGVAWNYTGHSDHAPLLTAVKDLYPEEEMWDRIANCDINREWSASIVQNKGELRAYFCEVAASFDLARGTDNGIPLTEGWWNKHITDFSDQIKLFCPGCGVPAKQKGHKDHEEIDTYTDTNADLAVKSLANKNRKIMHLDAAQKEEVNKRVTLYNSGH